MRLTVVPAVLLLAAAFMAPAVSAHAEFTDLSYTVLATDEKGNAPAGGFLDITELAIAQYENMLVFRITTVSDKDATGKGTIDVRFTIDDSPKTFSFKADKTYVKPPEDVGEDPCEFLGSKYYCTVLLDGVKWQINAGDGLTDIKSSSKVNAQELPLGNPATTAATYTVKAAAPAGPATIEETLDSGAATIELNATGDDDTYVYTWNNTFTALKIVYDIVVNDGSLDVVASANGTELVNQSFPVSASGAVPVESAFVGEHTITISLTDFNGTLTVELKELDVGSQDDVTDGTGNTAEETGNVTDDGHDFKTIGGNNTTLEEDSPGVGLVAIMAVLGLLVVAIRRRS